MSSSSVISRFNKNIGKLCKQLKLNTLLKTRSLTIYDTAVTGYTNRHFCNPNPSMTLSTGTSTKQLLQPVRQSGWSHARNVRRL